MIIVTKIGAAALGALPFSANAAERRNIGPFEIDTTEVTVGQFRAYALAKGILTVAEREGGGYEFTGGWTRRASWTWQAPFGVAGADAEPAVHITWAEAVAYCAAAGGRLPTSDDWRQAAYTESRAAPTDGFILGKTYPYPVGDTPDGMNINRRGHVPVGTSKRGANGLYDMGGNAWEWLADRRGDDALTAGGSWWYGPDMTRAEGAQWKSASFFAVYIGFRCVYAPR